MPQNDPVLTATSSTSSQEFEDLPPPSTRRWDTKRKAQIVSAVRSGRITLEWACAVYAMSMDEFLNWQSQFDRYGVKGLMVTKIQEFRSRRAYG